MRFIADLIVAGLFAASLVAIATISIQNIEPVALNFLGFQSVPLTFGLWLSASVGAGAIASTVLLRLLVGR